MRVISCSWVGRLNIDVISPQIESMEPESKSQDAIFIEIDKLQFIWKCKGPSQNYFGKEKVEGLTQAYFKTYYEGIVIKSYWHQDKQWNRIQSPCTWTTSFQQRFKGKLGN